MTGPMGGCGRLAPGLRAGVIALALCCAPAAHAHGLRVSVQAQPDGVAGQAFYSDQTPAAGERVELYAPPDAAAPIAHQASDAQGRFRFQVAPGRSYRVVVEGEEGHRSEAQIALAPLADTPIVRTSKAVASTARTSMPGVPTPGVSTPEASTPGVDAAALAAAVRTELAPLREDLAHLETRIRLHDLIGGIGYLVGLAGLYAWWRARRSR